ncbi:MAG: sigma-54 dependent transcriptional regulator [Ignavibacteria bacterium]
MEKLIFIIDDEPSILKLLSHWVKNQWGYEVQIFEKGMDALNRLDEKPDLVLLDIMLPDINGNEVLRRIKQYDGNLPVIMLSAQGSVEVAIESIRIGAFDYFPKPIDNNRLQTSIQNALKNYELHRKVEELENNIKTEYSFENIISVDNKMQQVFKMVHKVLDNDVTVLIHGESGTGKELIARAIHYNGVRKDAPFVVVNCASIPRELLESELFGHEKGSFTGAYQKKIGKFEHANGGTLFLDEIGEMEMSLQAKILRVIQEKTFERVGGNEQIRSDVRIISATNRDLTEAVEAKEFREDLYYRLSSFPINIPPLRERRSDILILIDHFIEAFNEKHKKQIKGLNKSVRKLLFDYDWPGNVRELENTIERCVIMEDGDNITTDVLPPQVLSSDRRSFLSSNIALFGEDSPIIPFEQLKEQAIRHALKTTNGNIVDAAKKLKIGRATFYRLMEKYNIGSGK